ncbi:MAG: FlgD immunoglobulin-like domain containing protein [Bacteroidota bacterium]
MYTQTLKPAAVRRTLTVTFSALALCASLLLSGSLNAAYAQVEISNQSLAGDDQFSDATSILIGPEVTIEADATVSFNAPLVGFIGPVSIERNATVAVTPTVISGVSNEDEVAGGIPVDFSVEQNFPNPFSTSTQINYALPKSGHVTIEVFNLLGQRISTLHAGTQSAGEYAVTWNGRVESGSKAPGGIYHYQVVIDGRRISRQMVLIR